MRSTGGMRTVATAKPAIKARIDNAGLAVDSHANPLIADVGNNCIWRGGSQPDCSWHRDSNLAQLRRCESRPEQLASMKVTLQNTGSNDLVISTIGTSGVFTQTNTCPSSTSSLVPERKPYRLGYLHSDQDRRSQRNPDHQRRQRFYAKQTVKLTGTGD